MLPRVFAKLSQGRNIITLYKFNTSNNSYQEAINKNNEFIDDFISNRIKYKDSIENVINRARNWNYSVSYNYILKVDSLDTNKKFKI